MVAGSFLFFFQVQIVIINFSIVFNTLITLYDLYISIKFLVSFYFIF